MHARKLTTAVAAVPLLLASSIGIAYADNIQDTIADDGAGVTLVAGSSTGGTAAIRVVGNSNDGPVTDPGCNWDSGENPLVLDVITPSGITATPDPLSITACGTDVPVTFTASASAVGGIATVSIVSTPAGGGGYDNQVRIPITVTQPTVTNTAPRVSVTGVADGGSYRADAVPQPGCSVVDDQDTDEAATPVISNGAYNALGTHTVTCSYTDKGQPALTGTATATYTVSRVADTTPPVITKTVTGTKGLNDWYTSDVTIDWTVTETESSETLQLTGCNDVTVSEDQQSTPYKCSAVSEGGTAAEQTVSIKRDATAPTVTYGGVTNGAANTAGWHSSPVTVTFHATDDFSGPAEASQPVTSTSDGVAVVLDSPSFSDAAGNTRPAGEVRSPAFKIDTLAPNAPTATVNPEPNADDWNNTDAVVSFTSAGDNGPSGVVDCTDDVTVRAEGTNQQVTGTCTDAAGNVSSVNIVSVNIDKHGPVVSETVTVSGTKGLNDWYTSPVDVTFTATDALSGPATASKVVSSTEEGGTVQVASPAFGDLAGNTTAAGAVTKSFKIDSSAPSKPTFSGGPTGGVYYGSNVAAPTCAAEDLQSGASCTVGLKDINGVPDTGTAVGTHTYVATATNGAGLTSTSEFTYTVLAWTAKGFYSPVDMGGVTNTVKGGSTVPLKFELFAGTTELTSTTAVKSFTQRTVACNTAATVDEIEIVTTGGTSLRYDATGGQFVQNWQTPKKPGTCYTVTMTAQDGSTMSANFLLK